LRRNFNEKPRRQKSGLQKVETLGSLISGFRLLTFKDILVLLILGGIILGFFHPLIFLDQLPSFRDMYVFAYPMKVFASYSIQKGLIPLWDPYSGIGTPFYANLQSEIFYPPNFLFYLFSTQTALKFFIVLHFFFGGVFTYLFSRELGLSRFPALFSAIGFSLSGSLISIIDTTSALCATIWLPLVLFLSHRLLKSLELKWMLLTSFTLALQFLAGFPEVFILTLLSMGMMVLLLKRGKKGERGLAGIVCFLSIILALSLAMGQLLPFLEFIGLSTRSKGLTYDAAVQGALHPGHWIKLFIPDFYGNPMEVRPTPIPEGWLKGIYVGLMPLILAILATFRLNREKTLLILLSGMAVLFSLGDHFFLYRFLFPLGLRIVRFPSKFFILATFTLPVLSGYGLEEIQTLVNNRRNLNHSEKERRRMTLFLTILMVAGTLGVLVWVKLGLTWIPKLYAWNDSFRPEWAQTFFLNSLTPSLRSLTILLTSGGILLLVLYQKLPLAFFKGLVLILVVSDLFVHNFKLMPVVSSHAFEFPTRTVSFLKAELNSEGCSNELSGCISPFRVYSTPLTQQGAQFLLASHKYDEQTILTATDLLIPNIGLIFQIPNALTKGSVELASYERYRNKLESLWRSGYRKGTSSSEKATYETLLDRLNVKYVVSAAPLSPQEFDLVQEGPVKIFQNKTFLPRAYRVPDKDLFKTPEIPADQVVPVKIEQITPHDIKIELSEEGGKWLVLANQYYPGWRVYGDGREMMIQEVDDLFMGLELPPGIRHIQFKYQPGSFKIGLFVSLWTSLVILSVVCHGLFVVICNLRPIASNKCQTTYNGS
jgi:hypothetical protein